MSDEAAEERAAIAALGHALLAEGVLGDAQVVWEGLAELDPKDDAPWRALAVIAARQGRWDQVETLAEAALGRRPGPEATWLRAEARWRQGRYREAAEDLRALVAVRDGGDAGELLARRAAAVLARMRKPGA